MALDYVQDEGKTLDAKLRAELDCLTARINSKFEDLAAKMSAGHPGHPPSRPPAVPYIYKLPINRTAAIMLLLCWIFLDVE